MENEIQGFLQSWADAWKKSAGPSGKIDAYMDHYSDLFSSGKLNKAAWRKDKAAKAKSKQWIDIELNGIAIKELTPGKIVEVRFEQVFKSPNFQDKGKKILVLGKEPAGWRIVSEKAE